MNPSTQAGFSADGAGGSGLPAEGTWALSRALTQRTSQKIVFSIHQGSGGWGPSLLAADLVSRPLPHRSLSASNVKMQRKEAALIWDSAWSPPSDTWDGKKWEPGGRHQALLSHLLSVQAIFEPCLGRDMGRRELWGEKCRLCRGNQELS